MSFKFERSVAGLLRIYQELDEYLNEFKILSGFMGIFWAEWKIVYRINFNADNNFT